MRAKLRRLAAENKKLDLIVVDYLQLMSGSRRNENRQQEVSQISRDLKSLAKEFNTPVIALSQLSRAPEARNPPRPMMSDLRESGSIEQDADVVAFIFRQDYYSKNGEDIPEEEKNIAEIIIAKQRNGPTDTIKLAFLKQFTRFEDSYLP
jgi:replicative DNA helicase